MSLTLCVVFLAGLAAAQQLDDCPSTIPQNQYLEVYSGVCYQFVTNNDKDYLHARQDCRTRGGILAAAKTEDVQNFLQTKLTTLGVHDDVWIGLNDIDTENTFVWEDGTPLDASKSNWADGSGPREGIIEHRLEDCVGMDMQKAGLWVDFYCTNELFGLVNREKKYICQYIVTPATTAGPQKMTINTILG